MWKPCDAYHTERLSSGERGTMTQPRVVRNSRSAVAEHPVISAIIAILVFATIFFSVYVPLYASEAPKVGSFPFFYFYLLAYMPVVAIALGIVLWLQGKLKAPAGTGGQDAADLGEVTK
jgi:hypothetical protein